MALTIRTWVAEDFADSILPVTEGTSEKAAGELAEAYIAQGWAIAAHVLKDGLVVSRHFSQQFKTMIWESTGKTVDQVMKILSTDSIS